MLLAAAERRLGDELDRRAKSLVEAGDEVFELIVEEDGRPAVGWQGNVLARMAAGRSLLEPALRTSRALDQLSAARRAELRARLEAWLDAQVDRNLRALKKLAAAATDRSSSPGVRALAAMLADAGGALTRRTLVTTIAALEQSDRQTLHKLGVRLGPLDVFVPALLKPASQQWRAILQSVRTNLPMPKLPSPGAATLDSEADARGASLAYRRFGQQWLRIDLADRLASHAHKVRSAGGDEPVDMELATSVGLDEAGIAKLMEEVGFTRAGEAWKWRGRRPPRQDNRAPGSHAFAELAKLKR